MKKLLILTFLFPSFAFAAVCESIFDGDKAVSVIQGKPSNYSLNLINSNLNASQGEVTAIQIQAVYNAKEKIQRLVGISPKFVICGDKEPNAFAFQQHDGAVVGVSLGMLKLLNGDEDMAAAVIGHEIAHHTKNHRVRSQQNELITNIISSLIGVYVESKVQQRYRVRGVGDNIAVIGSALTLSKFSRDYEREADDVGFQYMVEAGYSPEGSIRLAEAMLSNGFSGAGLFYDSHPSWEERTSRFKSLIAGSQRAQQIIASKVTQVQTENVLNADNLTTVFDSSISLTQAQINTQLSYKALLEKDLVKAEKYTRLASEAGEPSSQYNLGFMYEKGDIVKKDLTEALRLYRLSANQNFALAQTKLGFLYMSGFGVLKDEVEGLRWTKMAAENGEGSAQYNLGLAYVNGLIKPSNQEEAFKWWTLSAQQGFAAAQASLGSYYFERKNYSESLIWYKLAAAQNHGGAYASIGSMYWSGLGVPKDSNEALRLFKLAAKYGYQPAIDYLSKNNIPY